MKEKPVFMVLECIAVDPKREKNQYRGIETLAMYL